VAYVSGKAFIEHNSFPILSDSGTGRFQRWQRIAGVLKDAITCGELAPGAELPSLRDLATRYELPFAAVRHAVESLAAEGLLNARPGRSAIVRGIKAWVVHGDPVGAASPRRPCRR
jgi:DNA-binding FadR family transcriptional regulator